MPSFHYRARTRDGTVADGLLEAADRRNATQKLHARGMTPITVAPQASKRGIDWKKLTKAVESLRPKPAAAETEADRSPRGGTPRREKIGLSLLQRLLELHSSGLPVGDAIRILSQRLSDPEPKRLANDLWRDLSEGATLAAAMTRRPKYFSGSISYVIEAGEATGNLEPILRKVIDYLEEKREIRQKMLASMAYPGFICAVALGVVILFLTVLLPEIQNMLDRLGGEMTWSARLLIDGSDQLVRFGPFLLLAGVILAIGVGQWRRSPKGRLTTDRWLLRVPLAGPIAYYADLFQAGNLISTLLESGINTTETLNLTERTIQNRELRERFHTARGQVNEGLSIAQAFKRNRFMPDLALDILAVGENTGNLAQSMTEVTKGFRESLTRRLTRLTGIVSSGALVFAFALVTLIAIGIVTSVFQVSKTLST